MDLFLRNHPADPPKRLSKEGFINLLWRASIDGWKAAKLCADKPAMDLEVVFRGYLPPSEVPGEDAGNLNQGLLRHQGSLSASDRRNLGTAFLAELDGLIQVSGQGAFAVAME
ncbi:MAG: hypothetical protein ACYDH9_13930 [Limisphaerales bacterium]